jgi:uncharacterized membrane protein YkoI
VNRTLYAAAAVVVAVAIGGGVYAAQSQDHDAPAIAMALAAVKIDIIEAITAAERHVDGKAASAELERENGRWLYEIEVIKEKVVMEVKVDSESGQVISAIEEKDD